MKKKLLLTTASNEWNNLVKKFIKLHKRISTDDFYQYSERQQKNLLRRFKIVFSKLEKLQHKVGIAIAGSALFLMFNSTVSFSQTQQWRPKVDSIPLNRAEELNNTFANLNLADLDEDGDLDICMGLTNGTIKVYKNDGSGLFPDDPEDLTDLSGTVINVGAYAAPEFADLDGDDDHDLYVGTHGYIKQYMNQGLGLFIDEGVFNADGDTLLTGSYANPAFADLDGDGDLDLYVASQPGTITEYINDGGTFTQEGTLQADGEEIDAGSYVMLDFADMDGDGNIDLYTGSGATGNITFYHNDGSSFSKGGMVYADSTDVEAYFGWYPKPAFADLDNDGTLELLASNMHGKVVYFEYVDPTSDVQFIEEDNGCIYPNPARNNLFFKNISNDASIRIYDVTGSLISENYNINNKISIESLETGVYFVHVIDDKKEHVHKLIVK